MLELLVDFQCPSRSELMLFFEQLCKNDTNIKILITFFIQIIANGLGYDFVAEKSAGFFPLKKLI